MLKTNGSLYTAKLSDKDEPLEIQCLKTYTVSCQKC